MGYLAGFSPVLGLIVLALQATCAVHALRTGRAYTWLWIIFFLPVLGCLVYFVAEVLPEIRGGGGLDRVGSSFLSLVDRGRSIRDLEEQLDIADTVKNRQQLARAYAAAGRFDDAIQLYQRCLEGVYRDDPQTMLDLCRVYFEKASYTEARQILQRLDTTAANFRPTERELLLARTLEASGETAGALEIYASLSRRYPGEEARCRYAMLLQETGQTEKAQEVFAQVLVTARRSPRYYRRVQRPWIALARKNRGR